MFTITRIFIIVTSIEWNGQSKDSSLGERIHPERGVKWERGRKKFAIFRQWVAVSQKRCKIGPKLLWEVIRLSIGAKINDLGWPWTADMYSIAKKMRLSEPTTKMCIKIDPCCQRHKCSPMTTFCDFKVYADIRYSRAFPGDEASNNGIFQRFRWLFLRKLMRPAWLLYSDTQSIVSFSVIPVTLNDLEWLFRVKFCFRAGFSGFQQRELSKIIAWKLINIDMYCQRRQS